MYKLKRSHIIELLICIACCMIPFVFANVHVDHFMYIETLFPENVYENAIDSREIHHGVSVVQYNEILTEVAGGKYYNKRFDMPNGDVVISGSLRGETSEGVVIESLHVNGDARMHIFDVGRATDDALAPGDYDASLIIIDSADFDIACYTPKQYEYIEKEALKYYPEKDGFIRVKEASDGFDIEIVTPVVDNNSCTDFTLIYSEDDLVDWKTDLAAAEQDWRDFTMDGDTRWTYSGHYRLSDPTYTPTGDNVYVRNAACWFAKRFGDANHKYRLMDDMLCCVLETMADLQNEKGFVASLADSAMLQNDYNMYAPYYDTRFNSDLIEVFILGYDLYQNSTSYKVMEEYLDYFFWLAENHGRDDGNGGLWIPDYWSENADMDTVITALNHQLAEIIVLYKMNFIFNDQRIVDLADSMLQAIRNNVDDWIMADGSLEYGIYPDGSFGLQDYPYLTYNDLFNLQKVLERVYGKRDAALDKLMSAKLGQMQRAGITGYLTE